MIEFYYLYLLVISILSFTKSYKEVIIEAQPIKSYITEEVV